MGIYEGMTCTYCEGDKGLRKACNGKVTCSKHYNQLRRYGRVTPDKERSPHKVMEKDDHLEVAFPTGEVAYFDKEDIDLVKACKWCIDAGGYLYGPVKGRLARYHRHLFNHPKQNIDHRNRDKLDNRKNNLRLCSQAENVRNITKQKNNSSGHTGVERTPEGKWKARITFNYKPIHLGHFENIEDAVKARREAEIKYFGEFSPNYNGSEYIAKSNELKQI